MASTENKVRIANRKARTYNGIRKDQVIEVDESEVRGYEQLGFERLYDAPEAPEDNDGDDKKGEGKLDRKAIMAELTKLEVEFKDVGTSTKDLAKLLEESKA